MKIITFQHKHILNELKENGVYYAKLNSEYKKNTPKCYKMVFDSIEKKDPKATDPIFGWKRVFTSGDLEINSETIRRCMEMTGFDEKEYLLFELEIDDKEVSVQNFYNFVDARCEEEGIDPYYIEFEDFPFDCIFETKIGELQCTFTALRKEHIKNVYEYSLNKERQYEIKKLNFS